MTDKNDIINGNSGELKDPPAIIMTESARILLSTIEDILAEFVNSPELSPCDDEFYNKYRHLLDLYDDLQQQVADASGIKVVCTAGCSNCCCHWVEDVNSFEGIIIGRYLNEHHPGMTGTVITTFRKDQKVLDSLWTLVNEKTAAYTPDTEDLPDPYDLLLSYFYQAQRPCALLDDKGCCIVYPVRPFTCRDYLNLRDPAACLPDRINEEEYATLILYLSDIVSERLEILHRRFDDGSDDKSLRSLLVRCLDSGVEFAE